jgi:hypothetical protein
MESYHIVYHTIEHKKQNIIVNCSRLVEMLKALSVTVLSTRLFGIKLPWDSLNQKIVQCEVCGKQYSFLTSTLLQKY